MEEQILSLSDKLQIEQAHVVYEKKWDSTPPYWVGIHLITPGPDLKAEGTDQTWPAAALKALRELDSKIHSRVQRRSERRKSNLHIKKPGRHGLRK